MARSKKTSKSGLKKRLFVHIVIISILAVSLAFIVANWPQPCANSISCIKDLSGKFESNQEGVFMGRKVSLLSKDLAQLPVPKQVLGETSAPKHISVDLSNQRLYAYEGDKKMFDFPVSTGKWGRTPTGEYKIWVKLRYTRMSGGSGNDYYNLPNVPYVMFFYNNEASKGRGFSLHGAYWHNNFGYPMSHGCVNIRPEDAAKLYSWADPVTEGNITHATNDNPGTTVTIYGDPPT